jgi:hypothetical protein
VDAFTLLLEEAKPIRYFAKIFKPRPIKVVLVLMGVLIVIVSFFRANHHPSYQIPLIMIPAMFVWVITSSFAIKRFYMKIVR